MYFNFKQPAQFDVHFEETPNITDRCFKTMECAVQNNSVLAYKMIYSEHLLSEQVPYFIKYIPCIHISTFKYLHKSVTNYKGNLVLRSSINASPSIFISNRSNFSACISGSHWL